MAQYVALLDILGFKDIVLNNSHEDVVRLFENFRIYVQMSIANHKAREDEYGRAVFDVRDTPINSNIISDSIIFWTNDNSTDDFFELIEVLQRFITFCHSLPYIFLRGGISYREFHYDYTGVIRGKDSNMVHPIMVGRALVNIYDIEKKLQIAGCVVTEEAIEAARNSNPISFTKKWDELIISNKLLLYEVPLKNNCIQTNWTINWVREGTSLTIEELTERFCSFNKSIEAAEVNEKLINTFNYILKAKNVNTHLAQVSN